MIDFYFLERLGSPLVDLPDVRVLEGEIAYLRLLLLQD